VEQEQEQQRLTPSHRFSGQKLGVMLRLARSGAACANVPLGVGAAAGSHAA
jgi:hypothetical protein